MKKNVEKGCCYYVEKYMFRVYTQLSGVYRQHFLGVSRQLSGVTLHTLQSVAVFFYQEGDAINNSFLG